MVILIARWFYCRSDCKAKFDEHKHGSVIVVGVLLMQNDVECGKLPSLAVGVEEEAHQCHNHQHTADCQQHIGN